MEGVLAQIFKEKKENEFVERWEGSPLVIKKYEILYAIIKDKLGIEL